MDKVFEVAFQLAHDGELEALKVVLSWVVKQEGVRTDDFLTRVILQAIHQESVLEYLFEFYYTIYPDTPSAITFFFMLPFRTYVQYTEHITVLRRLVQIMEQGNHIYQRSPLQIVDEWIQMDSAVPAVPDTERYIRLLFDVYPSGWTREMIEPIVERANEQAPNCYKALFTVLTDVSGYAPVPPWVVNWVFDPYAYPLEDSWYQNTARIATEEVRREAMKEGVPYWVKEIPFTFHRKDSQSVYSMVENQDRDVAHEIHPSTRDLGEKDEKGDLLPLEEHVLSVDYPSIYHPILQYIMENVNSYWDSIVDYLKLKTAEHTQIERDYLWNRFLSMPLSILYKFQYLEVPSSVRLEFPHPIELEDLRVDRAVYRILGPMNTIPSDDPHRYGGERMFSSMTFSYDEETEEVHDWFLGACKRCGYKIRRRYHAFRIPLLEGGWFGCFCSTECARLHRQFDHPEDVLTPRLIQEIEDDLIDMGIQDRIVPPEMESS